MSSDDQQTRVKVETVSASRAGQRLDNFLLAHLPGVPRSVVYRLIRTGQVRVNSGRAKPFRKLQAGDQVRIPPVILTPRKTVRIPTAVQEQLEQAVIHDTGGLLVVNKPAGMAVHGGSGVDWGVVDAFRQSRSNQDIGLVHRLDRDTSGLLVLATDPGALRALQAQFRDRTTVKRYLSLLHGRLPQERLELNAPLEQTRRGGERYMRVGSGGKPACTRFRVLETYTDSVYVEAEPVTGRTHQIRVHAQHLGAPCAGDPRYSEPDSQALWRRRGLERLFLHAHALDLAWPGEERLQLSCPLPAELSAVLDRL